MFSIITIASSITKPVPIVSAINERLSRLKLQNHITPKVAMSDAGDDGGPDGAQENEHHHDNEADAQYQGELDVVHRGPNGAGAVLDHGQGNALGHDALQARQLLADAANGVNDIGARLTLNIDNDGRHTLVPSADLAVLQAVDDIGDIAEHDGRAAAIRDDQIAIRLDAGDLVIGGDRVGLLGTVERPFRARHIGRHDRGAQVLKRYAIRGKPREIGLDADRGLEPALDRD